MSWVFLTMAGQCQGEAYAKMDSHHVWMVRKGDVLPASEYVLREPKFEQ